NSPPSARKAVEHGNGRLRVSNMQAGQLASAISIGRLPLHKINFAGSVSGDVNSTWTRSVRNAVTDLKLEGTPPSSPSPPQLPVAACPPAPLHSAPAAVDVPVAILPL